MSMEDAVRRLEKVAGVHRVVVPEERVLEEALRMEDGVTDVTFGMPLENRALSECRKRDARICVFCDHSFEHPYEHVITMEDASGRMVAFDIPHGKRGDYDGRADIVWLSDDFAMLIDGDATKVVMHPQKLSCIGVAEGVCNAMVFYPATTTFEFLSRKLGQEGGDPMIAMAVVAFDWVVPSAR